MALPRASVLPMLAVVLGAALSFGAFFTAQSLERERGRAVFERHADNAISILHARLRSTLGALHLLTRFISVDPARDRGEFDDFASAIASDR